MDECSNQFPPGHRKRIKMFVEDIQARKTLKRKLKFQPSKEKSKIMRITDGDSTGEYDSSPPLSSSAVSDNPSIVSEEENVLDEE